MIASSNVSASTHRLIGGSVSIGPGQHCPKSPLPSALQAPESTRLQNPRFCCPQTGDFERCLRVLLSVFATIVAPADPYCFGPSSLMPLIFLNAFDLRIILDADEYSAVTENPTRPTTCSRTRRRLHSPSRRATEITSTLLPRVTQREIAGSYAAQSRHSNSACSNTVWVAFPCLSGG